MCILDGIKSCFNNYCYDTRPFDGPAEYDAGIAASPAKALRPDSSYRASPLAQNIAGEFCDPVVCGRCKIGKTLCWLSCGCCMIGTCCLACFHKCRSKDRARQAQLLQIHEPDHKIGFRPIHVAVWLGGPADVHAILESGANPNDLTTLPGMLCGNSEQGVLREFTWLTHQTVVARKDPEILAAWVCYNYCPAPLHLAIYKYKNNPEKYGLMIVLLVQYGADPDLLASKKYTSAMKKAIQDNRDALFDIKTLGDRMTPRSLAKARQLETILEPLFEEGKRRAIEYCEALLKNLDGVLSKSLPTGALHTIIVRYIQVFPDQWATVHETDLSDEKRVSIQSDNKDHDRVLAELSDELAQLSV